MLTRVTSSFARTTRQALRTQKTFQPLLFTNSTSIVNKRYYATEDVSGGKDVVAVLLAGCGYLDGTEVTEAVSTLIHLSAKGYKTVCFAPDANQEETVDHASKNVDKNEVRNLVAESTRISRNAVQKLASLRADAFRALVIPGGFGVAKNLSTYNDDSNNYTVDKEVERVILDFHNAGKPIGVACIAPVLAARVLGKKNGGKGITVTVGNNDKQAEQAIESVGSTQVPKEVNEVCVDAENRIVSTPAYQAKSPAVHEVHEGIGKMIDEVLRIAESGGGSSSRGSSGGDMNLGIMEEFGKRKYGDKWEEMKKQLA